VNLILFQEPDLSAPVPKRDERVVHLVKVLRKGVGDSFDAGLLGGPLGVGTIESIDPDGSVRFGFAPSGPPPVRHPLRIAVGFPRPIQLRRLLRDLSSLGVAAIDLVGTELGEKSYRDTNLLQDGGAREALIEGAVQARDTGLPSLAVYPTLRAWLSARPWMVGRPRGERPRALIAPDNVRPALALSALELAPGGETVLAIGSERGWSDRERDALEEAGFVRASMGERALRTETACVVAAALALEKIGVLG
jgi:RsmE family RNA methyltransferase